MNFSNPWFLATLIGTLGWFHLKLVADLLNLSRLSAEVPAPMRDVVTVEDQQRAIEYQLASTKLSVMEDSIMLALSLAFWWIGGFGWLDRLTMQAGLGSIGTGLLLLSILGLAQMLISLPLDAWRTFGVETEFNFNKTTPGTFIADRLKGLLLSALLGLPLLALLLWFFEWSPLAALWSWLAVSGFGLLMSWLSPRLFMPWFLKFTPMPEGELRTAILALARKLDFPVADISIVDGSRRSTKANAFFAGFGRTRRIALFDTLVEHHSKDEIVAVLAHEIGHAKLKHVPRQILVGLLMSGLMFALLHFALQDHRLYTAFGVMYPSTAMGFVLFMIAYRPWSTLLDPLVQSLSRTHEFQADRFAREAVGSALPMVTALKKLSRDHLAHLTPHPFYVWLHYSHPPMLERLKALES